MQSVAVIGNVTRDLVDGGAPRIGGGPFYAAQALRRLPGSGLVVTKCANDDRDVLLPDLLALDVPVEWHPAAATATFRLDYDGERRRVTMVEVGDTWTDGEVADWVGGALGGAGWVHVAPLARTDFPAATLAALADGRLLSYDGQGLVRPGRAGEVSLDADYDREVLSRLQVLKLAEEEAAVVLAGMDEASVQRLGVPEVLITLGPRGSLVFAGGPPVHVQAIAVDAEPTGAGDMFMAAYVAARAGDAAPVDAARSASRLVEQLLAERVGAPLA
jgi:sugar/nucleoside kinase (ribokinase family)